MTVTERARTAVANVLSVALASSVALAGLASLAGCEQIEGRNRARQANRLFRETRFVDAAAEYEKALTQVDDPILHYNAGLAYSKVFKPGFDGPVLLGVAGESVCQNLPRVKLVPAGACVKEGDRRFTDCGKAKTGPLEAELVTLEQQKAAEVDPVKKQEIGIQIDMKKSDLDRYVCASSYQCVEGQFCSLTSPEIANIAAQHFLAWLKAQPDEESLKKQIAEVRAELEEVRADAKAQMAAGSGEGNKDKIATLERRLDDLLTPDQTRKMMSQLWIDSNQFPEAIAYWEGLLQARPNDSEIMGNLAGINLKAGDWRKSIEWYNKVAEVTPEPSSKVAAYQFIGNVAWYKLNSRTLVGTEVIELADRGLGALQRAAEIQPKNTRVINLQTPIYNFRSTAHGSSWAGAIDRTSAQDLSKLSRVLMDEAKKAQGQPVAPAAPAATGTSPGSASAPPTAGSGSDAAAAGGAGSAAGSAAPATPPSAPAESPAAPGTAPAAGGSAPKSGG